MTGVTVDVWVGRLDIARPVPATTWAALDAVERERAERFAREPDRRAFALRRAFVRSVLGERLGVAARDVRFAAGGTGKPRVLGPEDPPLAFSVSASAGIALCAVCACEVGVDVERVRPDLDWEPAARHFFSPDEQAVVAARGAEGFFLVWTLKEAVIKARSGTLAHDLARVDVAAVASGAANTCEGLAVERLEVAQGYAAAVAVDHPRPRVRLLTHPRPEPAS